MKSNYIPSHHNHHSSISNIQKSAPPPEKPQRKTFEVGGTSFVVDERYQILKQIGHGAYGVVCSAHDNQKNRKVAIQKVQNAFEDLIDAKRILREIKLLRFFEHENIVSLVDLPRPETQTGYNDIYIITELMETDLHRVIYSRQVLKQN